MTSNIAKGGAFQRWCPKWVEDNYPGAVVHNEVSSSKAYFDKKTKEIKYFSHRNDILGCIDLIAIIPGCKVVFIQATLDTGVHKRLKDMVAVPWCHDHCIVQLWQDKGGGRKVVKQLRQVGDVSELLNVAEIVRGKLVGMDKENLFK